MSKKSHHVYFIFTYYYKFIDNLMDCKSELAEPFRKYSTNQLRELGKREGIWCIELYQELDIAHIKPKYTCHITFTWISIYTFLFNNIDIIDLWQFIRTEKSKNLPFCVSQKDHHQVNACTFHIHLIYYYKHIDYY